MKPQRIAAADLEHIHEGFHSRARLAGGSILITGCAGFLGYSLMNYFIRRAGELGLRAVIGCDTFARGRPRWLEDLVASSGGIARIHPFDVVADDIGRVEGTGESDVVLHCASIASPPLYRRHPIETLDANVWGLRRLLDFYRERPLRGFLFFSSSEVYGDPPAASIPTPENYRGNVSSIGPRACYDEAKRFGETLCYLYSLRYRMPIVIVRPFNNYGPGMRLGDGRLPADLARAIVDGRDLTIFSDGSPTRTFCYVADAVAGYLLALVHGSFDVFNIGIDRPEISVREFADIFCEGAREVFGRSLAVRFSAPPEEEYLTHNPRRRCPCIEKARTVLGYGPSIGVQEGVGRFLRFLREEGDFR
jgi:UDP-glucuronate decarboxylase